MRSPCVVHHSRISIGTFVPKITFCNILSKILSIYTFYPSCFITFDASQPPDKYASAYHSIVPSHSHRPIPIIFIISAIPPAPPPSPPRPPRPPSPDPIWDIMPEKISVKNTQTIQRRPHTLHLLHVHLVPALPLHHRLHHLLHPAPTPHLPLHLLQHPRRHCTL